MKNINKKHLFIFAIASIIGIGAHAQSATLQVNSASTDARAIVAPGSAVLPGPTDGFVVPRVNRFPSTAPSATANGMMLYLQAAFTTTATPPPGAMASTIYPIGFYYWTGGTGSPANTWLTMSGGGRNTNVFTNGTPTGTGATGTIYTDTLGASPTYLKQYLWNDSAYVPVGAAWQLTGNAGTTGGTNFIGTTDSVDFKLRSNNNNRIKFSKSGGTIILPVGSNEKWFNYFPKISKYPVLTIGGIDDDGAMDGTPGGTIESLDGQPPSIKTVVAISTVDKFRGDGNGSSIDLGTPTALGGNCVKLEWFQDNANSSLNIFRIRTAGYFTGTNTKAFNFWGNNAMSIGFATDMSTTGLGTTLTDNSLSVEGSIGIGVESPASKLDVMGATGYNQFRLRTQYTPTGTSDGNGQLGDTSWDDNYTYIKTTVGWKRTPLSVF